MGVWVQPGWVEALGTRGLQRDRGEDIDPSHQPWGSLAGLSFPALFLWCLGTERSCATVPATVGPL